MVLYQLQRYPWLLRWIHALMALMIVITGTVGWWMSDLPFSLQRLKLYNYHKWAGITILALMALRVVVRITMHWRNTSMSALTAPRWQQHIARTTHYSLYALMVIAPLSGWLMSSAKGFPIVWFGLIHLPDLVAKNAALAEQLTDVHELAAYSLAVLIVLHIAAALKHHWLDRDGILQRMSLI
jgi:cytochrome b561